MNIRDTYASFVTLLLLNFFGQNAVISGFQLGKGIVCDETEGYLPSNHTYYFTYTVFTQSAAFGKSNETNELKIHCEVIVNVQRSCQYLIHLSRCSLIEFSKDSQNGKYQPMELPQYKHFSRRMTKYPVTFSISNGEVIKLEAHKLETLSILNLKRGIISCFPFKKPLISNTKELRSDVHGTCPVTYQYSNSTLTFSKNMQECHLPRKSNVLYSPWSLLWNMSFIQKVRTDSRTFCQQMFNKHNGSFDSSNCIEEHSWPVKYTSDSTSFQTKITQTLKLQHTTTLRPIIYNANDFYPTTLHYEYDRNELPKTNPPDLKETVTTLMEALITENGMPIAPESINTFDRLIKLLRQSANLSEVAQELPSCWNLAKCHGRPITYLEYNDYQFYIGQIWRDALVQCNRLPCIRALKLLLHINQGFLEHVVSDNYLNLFFLSWSAMPISNVEYFTEMLEICKMKPTRPCILSLSSAVHSYWQQYKDKWNNQIPKNILEVVYYVADAIGLKCGLSPSYNKAQIVLSLKAITNLGEVAELARPDILKILYDCMTNDKAYWPIPAMAIQATKRFHPTSHLYQIMLEILKCTKSKQDQRVSAYLILVDKYSNNDLLKEIMLILQNQNEEQNLQTFIISNLKAIESTNDPEKVKFAKLISEARSQNPDIFRRRVDDLYVSKSTEHHFRHATTFLKDSINQFGYSFAQDILRNKETFLPYSLTDKLQVELFGKKFDLYEVYSNSRGMMKSYEVFLSYFFNAESVKVTKALQSVMKVLNIFHEKSSNNAKPNKFSYHVDDRIFGNLHRIRKERLATLEEMLPSVHDVVFTLKILGEELGFTTSESLQDDIFSIIKSWIIPPIHKEHPTHSLKIKLLEALHQMPTLSGLQLTWATDAFLHLQLKEKRQLNYLNFHYEHQFDFSAIGAIKRHAVLELPGVTSSGAETLSTLSTSVGAIMTTMHSYKNQTFKLSVKIPRHSLHLISLTNRNAIIRGSQSEEMFHPGAERVGTRRCSDILVNVIGAKLCHSKSYSSILSRQGKQWTFTSPNSNWNLTAEYDMRHNDSFEVNFGAKRESSQTSDKYSMNLSILDPVVSNKFHDVMNYLHTWDKASEEHTMLVDIPRMPYLNAKAKIQQAKPESFQQFVNAEATILQNITFSILYQVQTMQTKKNLKELKNYSIIQNGRDVPVDVKEHLINFTTPFEHYTWNYTFQEYPQAFVYDHILICHKTKEHSNQWVIQVLPDICGHRQTGMLQLHHETQHTSVNLSLAELPHLTYNYLRTPTSITELDTFYGSTPNANRLISVNIVQKYLPMNDLVTFLKFSSSLQQVKEKDTHMTLHRINITTPLISYTAGYRYGRMHKNYSATLFFQKSLFSKETRKRLGLKINDKSGGKPENTRYLDSEVDVTFEVWVAPHKICNAVNEYYGLTSPLLCYHSIIVLSYNGDKITLQTDPENVDQQRIGRNFLLDWPSRKLQWTAQVHLENVVDKISFNSSILHLPNHTYASYKLNYAKNTDNFVITFTDQFESLLYEHSCNLELKVVPRSILKISISSYSPLLGKVMTDLMFSSLKASDAVVTQHDVPDVILELLWLDGMHGTFNITSMEESIIPSVLGEVHYKGQRRGGNIQLSFSNNSRYLCGVYEVLSSTGIKFVTFLDKPCNTTEDDSDFFIGSLNFIVVDGRNIETDLTINRNLVHKIESDVDSYVVKAIETLSKEMYDPESEINKRLSPHLENKVPTVGHWVENVQLTATTALTDTFSSLDAIPNSMKPIVNTITHPFQQVYYYMMTRSYSMKAIKMTKIPDIYRQLELYNCLPRWMLQTLLTMVKERFAVPGPNSKTVYRFTMPLPFYQPTSTDYFTYANPTFFRPFYHLKLFAYHSQAYRDIFYDHKYSRFALLLHPGNIYTFEGAFLHLHGMLQSQCSYLLSHDFENQKFTIYYYQSNLHFLFPDTKVILTPKGEITVNDSHSDFPVEHWNREIQLSRKENLVEVQTKYNLKVVCEIEQFYCIFYTNAWKFNQLIGLLGNNNDNPADEATHTKWPVKDNFKGHIAHYELTGKAQCTNQRHPKDLPYEAANHWKECRAMSNFLDFHRLTFLSPTFLCQDIIPPDQFQFFCGRCSAFPCVNVKAYLALCAANYVPVGGTPFECESCGQHELGDQWDIKTDKNLEVIFVIDQEQLSESQTDYLKGLDTLITSIDSKFVDEGYNNIKYGLVGFRGKGFQFQPQQHTINSKLFATAKELKATGIRSLKFLEYNDTENDVVFAALQLACHGYELESTSQHMIILITAKYPKTVDMVELHRTLKQLKLRSIVLYVFSKNDATLITLVQEIANPTRIRQSDIRKSNKNLPLEYSTSPYSVLAYDTNGAFWPISHLQEKNMQHRLYLDAIADEMATSMARASHQCRTCKCSEPKYYQSQTLCDISCISGT